MSFGDRIKESRLAKGYTQEQLAKIIGVAKSTLTGYEKGNREPNLFLIKELAIALDISADYLLGTEELLANNKKSPSIEKLLNDDEDIKTIYKLYSSLDEEGKRKAEEFAEYLLAKQEAEKEKE